MHTFNNGYVFKTSQIYRIIEQWFASDEKPREDNFLTTSTFTYIRLQFQLHHQHFLLQGLFGGIFVFLPLKRHVILVHNYILYYAECEMLRCYTNLDLHVYSKFNNLDLSSIHKRFSHMITRLSNITLDLCL